MHILSRKGQLMSGKERLSALTGGHMASAVLLSQLGIKSEAQGATTPAGNATVGRVIPAFKPLESRPSLA